MNNIIPIASDHAGYELKEMVKEYLLSKGYEIKDFGTNSLDSCDYPDFIHPLASAIESGEYPRGIILCGSANGVSMTANKYQGIRAALSWIPEIAEMARLHNDANIVSIPARYVTKEIAFKTVDMFLDTKFEGGRHQARVDKIRIAK